MSDAYRSLRQRTWFVLAVVLAAAAPAWAQAGAATPPVTGFLTRFDFAMSAAALKYDDSRFKWDTHWAGEFDLVDYGHGRATFLGDYQALLGNEFRPFDPYQSNYLLEASGSVRLRQTEVAGVLNHLSRHLGDRFKRVAVAENSLGVRVMRGYTRGRASADVRVDVRKVIARAFVDYTAYGALDTTLRYQTTSRTSGYLRVIGQGYTVDPELAGRNRQYGGRAELGVRVKGQAGAFDFFIGAERMMDADPLDRIPRRWAFGGFRLLRR